MRTEEPESLRIGELLAGRYRIGPLIGSGGYGRIYRATDVSSGAEVAVKVIHGIDDELRARFAQEATIVQRLESPHTVRLFDHGVSHEGQPFMVLELLRGTSVWELLERQQTLSPRVALEITAQILDSLAEAHAMGIVHRDIKPENVFVTSQLGQPTFAKLLDFGIAKQGSTKKLTMQGQVVGTPSYMAPEQTSGGVVDARTDLYAVGLLLAEMVTGRTVMAVGGPITIMLAQAKRDPVPLGDDVRQSIVGPIVARAVEKAPSDRYPSANDMLVDVRAKLGDVNATSVGPTRVAEAHEVPDGVRPTMQGIPAHHTIASPPVALDSAEASRTIAETPAPFPSASYPSASHLSASYPSAPFPSASYPSAPHASAPHGSAPFISPAPRVAKRKGGPVALPLIIVALAAVVSVVIVVLATGSRSDDKKNHSTPVPHEDDDDDAPDPRSKVRRARTSDPAEIRRLLLGAGYKLTVDQATPNAHTFAPQKLPCVGSIVIMPLADAATARRTADIVAERDTQGILYLVEGRSFMTVALFSTASQRTEPTCMDPVVALLAK